MRRYLFFILFLSGIFSCNKSSCPDPAPQIYLTDSLDHGNCNCRIITATVINSNPYTLTWTNSAGQSVASGDVDHIQVCPTAPIQYNAVIEDEVSYRETSITVVPKTECDAKQITTCTRVLIESINDLIQLYQNAPGNSAFVPLSNSGKYEGVCIPDDNDFGQGKLNAIYGSTDSKKFYKIVPMPLSCSFLISSPERDSIKAPLPEDFVNGVPPYLSPGERVYATPVILIPWSDYLFSMIWTTYVSGYSNLGICPPKKEFISYSGYSNELYIFYFFTPKPGCSFKDAYETMACKDFINHSSIKRIFDPRIDARFCEQPFSSDYDYTGRNIKVTIERTDGAFIDAYLSVGNGEGNQYDGFMNFMYKQDRSAYPCP